MVSAQRVSLAEVEEHLVRAAAWDNIAPGELSFDFSPPRPPTPKVVFAPLTQPRQRSAGNIKQAIIRWLDEQL